MCRILTMSYQYLTIEERNRTALVTINRPDVLNALNTGVIAEIDAVFTEILGNSNYKGVILTGAGQKSFVAGADISELAALTEPTAVVLSKRGQAVFAKIENFPKPVVAAVNGFALGGGCELAMACHLRIASENAKFGQPEVNLGIIAGYGGTQRLTRLIGKTKALELLLTTDMITAAQAQGLGLVNAVVPIDQLIETALAMLQKCYKKSPRALANTITAVNACHETGVNGYEVEATLFGNCCHYSDFKEGTTAFLEKRAAQFQDI